MRGQVPGTARDRARIKSAINNYQASNYVKAPEGVAQCLGLPRHRTEAPRYRSMATVAGATMFFVEARRQSLAPQCSLVEARRQSLAPQCSLVEARQSLAPQSSLVEVTS